MHTHLALQESKEQEIFFLNSLRLRNSDLLWIATRKWQDRWNCLNENQQHVNPNFCCGKLFPILSDKVSAFQGNLQCSPSQICASSRCTWKVQPFSSHFVNDSLFHCIFFLPGCLISEILLLNDHKLLWHLLQRPVALTCQSPWPMFPSQEKPKYGNSVRKLGKWLRCPRVKQ